jgi:DNA-directed RNA polymerase specialized sigma24 family protein
MQTQSIVNSFNNSKKEFDKTIEIILTSNLLDLEVYKPHRSFLSSTKQRLKQFNLDYDVFVVVSEAYNRGLKLFDSGTEIEKPIPWLRKTAHNIIYEMSREQAKERATEYQIIEYHLELNSNFIADDNNQEDLNVMQLAFNHLNANERQILTLRVLLSLSWKKVVEQLLLQGEVINETTARKRGERALSHLKEVFQTIKIKQHSN